MSPKGVNTSNPEDAFFMFTDAHANEFVFKLTDLERIREARGILSGQIPHKGVLGIIIKEPVNYNPGWSFHLDPSSIEFFELAAEVCDSAIHFVEENLDEVGGAFLPHNIWCPWSSRLTKEVFPSESRK